MATAGVRTALVTGASGFLAPAVCSELAAAGFRVRGLVRAGSAPSGVEPFAGDLRDRVSLRNALRGAAAVVHLAGRVHRMPSRRADPADELAAFREHNVQGTRNLAEEAAAAGVSSFVHISSVKAVAASSEAPLTEAAPPAPPDPYGVSKLESESVVREIASAHQIQAAVLRLPLAYGAGVRANMLRLFRLVDRGVPLPLDGIHNRRSLLYAGNLAAAVGAVLRLRNGAADTFFVSDGEDVSTPELVRLIAGALARPVRLLPFPSVAARSVAMLSDRVSALVPVPFGAAALQRLTGSLQVDISRIRATAGYVPRFTVAEGIAETAAWYKRSAA